MKRLQLYSVLMTALLALWAVAPEGVSARQTDAERALHAERSLVRGLTFMRTARFDDAVTVYTEALRLNPDNAALLTAMSEAQAASGDPGSAMFHGRRALEQAPDNPDVVRSFRDVSIAAGDMASAQSAAVLLVDLVPEQPRALGDLLALQLQLDQVAAAVTSEQLAAERFPDTVSLFGIRADILERAGETERLVDVLEKLHKARGARERLAAAYTRMNRFDDAARLWLEAPEHPDAIPSLAALLPDISDPDVRAGVEALDVARVASEPVDVERALLDRLASAPRNADILADLAALYMGAERWLAAGEMVERLVQADPRRLDTWVEGVAAFVRAGEHARAVTLGRDALLLYPGYGPLIVPFAEALVETGQRDEALSLMRATLERAQPSDPWTEPLRELLRATDSPQ